MKMMFFGVLAKLFIVANAIAMNAVNITFRIFIFFPSIDLVPIEILDEIVDKLFQK
jgi:hypothetical protein